MKYFYTVIFLAPFLLSNIIAQYKLDTLVRKQVGPGVMYTRFREPIAPNDIYVMEVDLKNPYIKLEAVKAKDMIYATEKPSVMAKNADSVGHHVIGIVNADFFLSTGEPDGMMVKRGEITRRYRSGYSAVGFDTASHYMMAYPTFSSSLITSAGKITINGVDEARDTTNKLIMYNSYFGTTTGTQSAGTEAVVTAIDGWRVNDTVSCIVKKVAQTTGNTIINKKELVLSGQGTADTFLKTNVKVGDTVKIYVNVSTGPKKITELLGGRPIFYINGQVDSSKNTVSVMPVKNPRTIIGFTKDSTKAYIIAVDGRQTFSVGMTMYEMAVLMKNFDIYNAMNFDGGGSTIMRIEDVTLNSPSDGSERAVSDALIVVSSAPIQNLASVNITPKQVKIFRGETAAFAVSGTDIYGGKIALPAASVLYTCDSKIGSVTNSGVFTANKIADSGYVYVSFNGIKDSAFVKVQDVKYFSISPKEIVLDSAATYQFKVNSFDADFIQHTIAQNEFTWTSSNTAVGTIDNSANFQVLKEGSINIIAKYKNLTDTAKVRVEIGHGTTIFNSLDDLSGWTVTGDNLDSLSYSLSTDQKSEGAAALKIDFKYSYGTTGAPMIYLNKNQLVYGIPDSIVVDIKSNGQNHKLYFRFTDDNGEEFRSLVKKYINVTTGFDPTAAYTRVMTPLSTGSSLNFPITLKRLEVQLAVLTAGQSVSGTLYFDNMRVKYPLAPATSVEDKYNVPNSFNLYQNYPNPFNPSTVIGFNVPQNGLANLKVYDILGREVALLINKELTSGYHKVIFNAVNIPSGIYFYKLQFNGESLVNKMMLLK